jgi:ribosomal-protein-alanine N-acetyltransferase
MDKGHLEAVAALERRCFDQPWSQALLERELYNDLVSFVVAQGEDGTVLGYGEIQAVLDEGCLEKIAVAPEYRRQGVAEAILSAFLRFGREHLAFLTLEVRESNAPAIALYEKLGFQVVGRRKNYYTQPREDAVLMTVEFSESEGET